MWEQIPLPEIKSTIRACSVPDRGDWLAIWTDEGLFRLRLHPSPAALFRIYSAKDAEKNYVPERGCFVSNGSQMHGDCGRHGWHTVPDLLSVHQHGFTVEIDEKQKCVHLLDPAGDVCLTVDFVNVMSRLLITHFNRHYSYRTQLSYFVVCDSTSLRVYVYRPASKGVPTKWSTSGSQESQQSLWNAIIENPDDDTPRLIYADWLEENRDRDRAEFIRLQCRIAVRESQEFIPLDDPEIVLNEQMENQHGDRWAGELGKIKGIFVRNSFWRGFPECLIASTSLVTRKSQQQTILAASPLEFVSLSLLQDADIKRIEMWELISRWRNIKIHSSSSQAFPIYVRLFKSPQLNQIQKVSFDGWFRQELNLALVSNGPFPQLHTITYDSIGRIDPETDFSDLGDAKVLPQLTNVIFNVSNDYRQFQERKVVRQLASRVKNVYLVLWERGKPVEVIKLKA